jgi:hypothetical protein
MQVSLEKAAVWAGEVVRGKVFYYADKPTNYREVFVEVRSNNEGACSLRSGAGKGGQRAEAAAA